MITSRPTTVEPRHLDASGPSSNMLFLALTDEQRDSNTVPFRNAHFLAIATSWAESIGASKIFIGRSEDSSGYPDCHRVLRR